MNISVLSCKLSNQRGAAGFWSASASWWRANLCIAFTSNYVSTHISPSLLPHQGIWSISFFPSVYLQHLSLFLGSPDSGWPGTVPVYFYCLSIIINSIHFHSQKCLGSVINYMVLLFISDLDFQPCKCSNFPILKIHNRHIPKPTPLFLCPSIHGHTSWKYCPDPFLQFPSLPLFL